jgi:hypothetical protein
MVLRPTRARWAVGALLMAWGLASCSSPEADAATSAAERLVAAVSRGNGSGACGLLAPAARTDLEDSTGTPCEEAILREPVGTGGAVAVEVFDTMAQVRLQDDTVFLSRFDGEWLVVAVACTPDPPGPYDCSIQAS